MSRKRFIPLVAVVLLFIAAAFYFKIVRNLGAGGVSIEGSGTIEVTEIDISTKISGRVAELTKDEGEPVKAGELVAKLEYEELNAQRLSIIANLDNARTNLKRVTDLHKTGSVSQKDFDAAQTAFKVAQANYNQISASIENAVIFSPINGMVLERNLEVGEVAMPGTPIITVADISKVWIKIFVDGNRIGDVVWGQEALVEVDSSPGRVFRGKVVAISKKAEFTPKTIQTRDERVKLMYAVKIALQNNDMALKPGMPADAKIIIGKKK